MIFCTTRLARREPVRPSGLLKWLFWALIANDDDGLYGGDSWRAGRPKTAWLAVLWWLRNPFHNLTWYVIGVADRERLVCGPFGDSHSKPGGGLLWSVTKVGWVRLPYVSYASARVIAYAGWRPSGAIGFKFARAKG